MSTTYFTSDSHFGHRGILSPRMDRPRPFRTVEDHDGALVERWNAVVRPSDTVWHLGDFAYRCPEEHARGIFERLNGRKFLVVGNHDKLGRRLRWDVPPVDVARVEIHDARGRKHGIWLSHYAHLVWPRMHHGELHLYGHSHGSIAAGPASLDVGVDCWDYAPATVDDILARLTKVGAVDRR